MFKKNIFNTSNCAKLMMLVGFFILIPLLVLPFYKEDIVYASSFIIPGLTSIIIGFIICLIKKEYTNEENEWKSSMRKSSLTVLFAWFFAIFAGALPFVIGGKLTLVQGMFEAVSGWTTTGLSVMNVVETEKIFLFHRAFMQYCGGLGFVMMMLVIVSSKSSMDLFNAEGHPDKLMPNLRKTARVVFVMYNSFLILGIVLYVLAGMNLFDSICHAMCSLSTGGFSNRLNSIGEYNNFYIELVTIFLMIVGTTNFAALMLFTRRKYKAFFKVSEVRFMFGLFLVFVPITAINLCSYLDMSIKEGFRRSFFDIASALSTTGYSSMSYENWPALSIGVLILMMLIGGGIGSTAGGIKLSRVYIMLKVALNNIKKRLCASRSISNLHYTKAQGKTQIDMDIINESASYITCYLFIYIVGSLLITVSANCSLTHAMFEFASALGTVGISIGITNGSTNNMTLIIEMIGMLFGRLEIFIIIIGIYSGFNVIGEFFKTKRKKVKKVSTNNLKEEAIYSDGL